MKRAQDEGRKLITQIQKLDRGKNVIVITETIQGYIDSSLNLLPLTGTDNDVRVKILNAQTELRDFQNTTNNKNECVSNMHSHIQDSISLCKARVSNLEIGGNNE